MGLLTKTVSHADYGGCTTAQHVCGFGVAVLPSLSIIDTPPNVRRNLSHFLSVAVEGSFAPHPKPPPLPASVGTRHGVLNVSRTSSVLRCDSLLPCYAPDSLIACSSVFGPKDTDKYIMRSITAQEALCIFSIPSPYHDSVMQWATTREFRVQDLIPFESAVSADILASFAFQLWGSTDGGVGGSVSEAEVRASDSQDVSMIDEKLDRNSISTLLETEDRRAVDAPTIDITKERVSSDTDGECNHSKVVDGEIETDYSSDRDVEHNRLNSKGVDDVIVTEPDPENVSGRNDVRLEDDLIEKAKAEALERIRLEKARGKAAKADDAEVPVQHWNNVILEKVSVRPGTSVEDVAQAVDTIRAWGLRYFWKKLRKACTDRLVEKHGKDWTSKPRISNGKATELSVEIHALATIMWHATQADWFEYKSGSALHYFRFPIFYQGLAKDGVPVFFEKDGPKSRRKQPPMTDEKMKETVAAKIGKVIKRGYVFNSGIRLLSLIKYFAVPKTDTDYRLVYDATANNLNDAVWAPSFWLPTIDTLVRYIDAETWMMDRDIGDMFLNFPLDKRVWPYTGLHLGDVFDENSEEGAEILEKAGSKWVHWGRCLMGFKPSPYNAIKTSLVVEEVVKGDRHCDSNPFQWDHIRLNLPGEADYDPRVSWISKLRKDGLIACDLFTFVDDERCTGPTRELAWEAGHRLASVQAYFGIQDAARKVRPCSLQCGAWAGSVVHVVPEVGVCVLTSQEKWDRFKEILTKWLERLERGDDKLEHKELLSDRGFCVYLTKSYPAMVPYLKGFHLTIEMWRGGRDEEGWKLPPNVKRFDEDQLVQEDWDDIDETLVACELNRKLQQDDADFAVETNSVNTPLNREEDTDGSPPRAPPSGYTTPVPRFIDDVRALVFLADSDKPPLRVVRSKMVYTAVYGFGDASGKGFCGTTGYQDGVNFRLGVWGRDEDSESSNFKELKNLVDTTEEEAASGRLAHAEFFLFTDNSTAENSFHRGSSTSKLLHDLVLRLRKLEIEFDLIIYVIHVAGTRMIAQGTDGGSRGSLLEGVMTGKPMLKFVDLSRSALDRHPQLLHWIRQWTGRDNLDPLTPEDWFVKGHGINGGALNSDKIWIPTHEGRNNLHLWAPPPAVADAMLEELLKARHKRTDTYHVVIIPRLMAPRWRRLFYKVCDFTCVIPAGNEHWPANMFEPLFLGIVLPFTHHRPWQLKRAPLLLELERDMRGVLKSGETDGGDILRKLLKLNGRLRSVSQRVACGMLHMPGTNNGNEVSHDGNGG